MAATSAPRDVSRLESLGYAQELKRNISFMSTFGFSFSIMGIVPSGAFQRLTGTAAKIEVLIGSLSLVSHVAFSGYIWYSLPYGGPVAMNWGWFLAGGLILFIGLSMAELASSMPTSGGLYFWTHRLGPPKYRNLLAWFVGYNSFLGNVAATSSLAWACAGIVFAAVSIADNTFTPTTAQTFGLYVGILLAVGALCAYGSEILIFLQTPNVILNALLILATVIGLPIARRNELNTAEYTLGDFTNLTGWSPGMAFLLSMLAPVWTICSFDCAVSLSEEASNASTAVPWAIVLAIGIATLAGGLIMIILSLTMGTDLAAINDSAIGQPLAYIYDQAFGKHGSLAIWSFMCIGTFFMTASLAMPASRQAFAFARDGALPFSKYLYHVNKKTQTPVRTVWLIIALCIPLGALGFADEAAINAIFALAILGPYVAYGIPIACRLFTKQNFQPGPWHLGRFSKPCAAISCVWMIFACVIFCFPADINPDPATMNYACVVAGGVWAFSLGYYFLPGIGGKTFFRGPVTTEYEETYLATDYADIAIEADMNSNSDTKRDGKDSKTNTTTTVRPLTISD